MMQRTNGLGRRARPTKKAYRAAVRDIIVALQSEFSLNDPELAERLGCSGPTIANARNERCDLSGVTLANIEHEFGPSALDPFLALGGSRSVPISAPDELAHSAPLELSEVLHKLLQAQSPASEGGVDITQNELRAMLNDLRDSRTALDALIAKAEGPPNPPLRAVAGS